MLPMETIRICLTMHALNVPANKQKYVPLSGNRATFTVGLFVVHAIAAASDVTVLAQSRCKAQ